MTDEFKNNIRPDVTKQGKLKIKIAGQKVPRQSFNITKSINVLQNLRSSTANCTYNAKCIVNKK